MIQFLREWWAMRKASKWFDKNPAAQARFEDLEDWLEEHEERLNKLEEQVSQESVRKWAEGENNG
tara:strand:+ start:1515 stop:1709 length:195 start_codon:yes stop_codon:yes gene_type:complete